MLAGLLGGAYWLTLFEGELEMPCGIGEDSYVDLFKEL